MTDVCEHKVKATIIALDMAMEEIMATLSAHPQLRDNLSARLDARMHAVPE
jgi:hypothetical protein